jgi:hypothetical protein
MTQKPQGVAGARIEPSRYSRTVHFPPDAPRTPSYVAGE